MWCQSPGKNPTKTHHKQTLICSWNDTKFSNTRCQRRGTECIIETESSMEEETAVACSSKQNSTWQRSKDACIVRMIILIFFYDRVIYDRKDLNFPNTGENIQIPHRKVKTRAQKWSPLGCEATRLTTAVPHCANIMNLCCRNKIPFGPKAFWQEWKRLIELLE